MFRFGKRNFSLRDSPSKLSSSSPRTSLCSSSPAPAKRIKFGDGAPLMSSTFLSESSRTLDDNLKVREPNQRAEPLRNQTIRNETFRSEPARIESNRCEPTLINGKEPERVTIETPPPTPEIKITPRLDFHRKQKSQLLQEGSDLDQRIQSLVQAIEAGEEEIQRIKASRYKYEDFVNVVTRGQNEIRDQLNQIFGPGNELAQRFEPTLQELSTKHNRKFERKFLEWNCLMDQARCIISKKSDDLEHEIELHERTILHQEHLNRDNKKNKSDEIDVDGDGDGDDCILIEPDVAVQEEIVASQQATDNGGSSAENKHKEIDNNDSDNNNDENQGNDGEENQRQISNHNSDDEATDVEEISSNEARSFTPCQAQRPE